MPPHCSQPNLRAISTTPHYKCSSASSRSIRLTAAPSSVWVESAEDARELTAWPPVPIEEFAVAVVGDFEVLAQGVVVGTSISTGPISVNTVLGQVPLRQLLPLPRPTGSSLS